MRRKRQSGGGTSTGVSGTDEDSPSTRVILYVGAWKIQGRILPNNTAYFEYFLNVAAATNARITQYKRDRNLILPNQK